MKKFLSSVFAALVFISAAGCGGEKEYKEPEPVQDLEISGEGVPAFPGE